MKRILFSILLCLILVSTASAATERITNGGFETGSFSPWTPSSSGSGGASCGEYEPWAHSGSHYARLEGSASGDTGASWSASIQQSVDLTGVSQITFYSGQYITNVASPKFRVYIDSTIVWEETTTSTRYTAKSFSISGYTGTHTVKFETSGTQTGGLSSDTIFMLDDISALGDTPVSITSHSPASNPSSQTNTDQTFAVGTNIKSSVVWKLDGITQETDSNIYNASYTGNKAVAGNYNVTAIATNGSTSSSYGWIWSVSYPAVSITSHSPSSNPSSETNTNQTFAVGTNIKSSVVWKLDGITQETDSNIYNASYTGNKALAGNYNVTAIATNDSTSASYSWLWSVSAPSSNSENQTNTGYSDIIGFFDAFSVIVPSVGNMVLVVVPTVIVLSVAGFLTGFWHNITEFINAFWRKI